MPPLRRLGTTPSLPSRRSVARRSTPFYGEGYDEPLATPDGGLPGLLTKLVEELGNISVMVGSMVEGECRTLFTAAPMSVFNHLYLRDSSFDLGALIEPVPPESRNAAAEAVKK